MDKKFAWKYFRENWKQGVHLIFHTKRFGVNNRWWNHEDGLFGWPTWKIVISIIKIRPIIRNYKLMKFRAAACHFVSEETAKGLGWYRYWEKKKCNCFGWFKWFRKRKEK